MSVDQYVRITSWNVAGRDVMDNTVIDHLFDDKQRLGNMANIRPEIQIVGLQEAPSYLFADPWTTNLSSSLSKRGYILFKRHKLSGILLYIFVLREILLRTRDFETESVKTGFGGLLGNKGGVSLRFTLNGNSICVTNSHLAAHQENLRQRIEDYHSIMNGTKFLVDSKTPSIISHDYSLWFGDLNFRFDDIEKYQIIDIISKVRGSAPEKIYSENLVSGLYKHDQLLNTKKKREAFDGFNETLPRFLPTYKFQIGSKDTYDTENRAPAWTDRILYRFNLDSRNFRDTSLKPKMEQLFYDSIPDTNLSDHKPITSLFKISTFDFSKSDIYGTPYEVVKFEPIVGWKADQDGRLWYKISNDLFYRRPKVLSSWDKLALYKADFASIEDYQTVLYANNIARVAPRLNAEEVPYHSSTSSSRSPTPNSSRRGSTTSLNSSVQVGVEAISLNSSANNSTTSAITMPVESSVLPPDAIIGDGFKYFSVSFSDDVLIPGKFMILYLKSSSSNEYNVYGISDTFTIAS